MTISSTPVVTGLVRWTLDNDGRGFADERERLRWYEGIVAAYGFQTILVPSAAAVFVWAAGDRAVAIGLVVVLAAFYLPIALSYWYVASRKVAIYLVRWTVKSVVLGQLRLVPYAAFLFGVLHAYDQIDVGTAVRVSLFQYAVLIVSGFTTRWLMRRRQRAEALAGDVD
jgi:hypothetical protein